MHHTDAWCGWALGFYQLFFFMIVNNEDVQKLKKKQVNVRPNPERI